MYIDPTLSGFKNIDMFIEGNGPSPKRGAFSNARIETIATTALVNYIENPAVSYEKHFLNAKNAKGMDISPQAYRQFENICDMVENPVKFKQKNFSDISSDVQELIDKYYDGEISKEEISNLKLAIKDIKTNLTKVGSVGVRLEEVDFNKVKIIEPYLDGAKAIIVR